MSDFIGPPDPASCGARVCMPSMGNSYDEFLPITDLAEYADIARQIYGYKWVVAGGVILVLGVVVKTGLNMWRVTRNKDADLLAPFITFTIFSLLLVAYKPLVMGTIGFVTHMGDTDGWTPDAVAKAFSARADAYAVWEHKHTWFANTLMQGVTGMLYAGVEGWVVLLRALQQFGLAAIVTYGPLLLGVASLHEFFLPVAFGWFWAMVQISAWSATMNILLMIYSKAGLGTIPQDFVLRQEFINTGVMLFLLIGVAGLTHFIIQGGSGEFMAASFKVAPSVAKSVATSQSVTKANTVMANKVQVHTKSVANWALRRGASSGSSSGGGGKTAESAWNAARVLAARAKSGGNKGAKS